MIKFPTNARIVKELILVTEVKIVEELKTVKEVKLVKEVKKVKEVKIVKKVKIVEDLKTAKEVKIVKEVKLCRKLMSLPKKVVHQKFLWQSTKKLSSPWLRTITIKLMKRKLKQSLTQFTLISNFRAASS